MTVAVVVWSFCDSNQGSVSVRPQAAPRSQREEKGLRQRVLFLPSLLSPLYSFSETTLYPEGSAFLEKYLDFSDRVVHMENKISLAKIKHPFTVS